MSERMRLWNYEIHANWWEKEACDFFIFPTVLVYYRNFTFAWGRCYINFMWVRETGDE